MPIAIERLGRIPEHIEVSSYRKRVLPDPIGKESRLYPTLRELSLSSLDVAEQPAFSADGVDFLVAQPMYFKKSMIGQYAASHHRIDMLDYTSLAVEMGVLDSESASDFLGSKHFIPGGIELGIYPTSWLIESISQIEVLDRQFLIQYATRVKEYSGYQVRAIGFLAERLGSFLLIRHLKERYSNNIPVDIFGHMTVLVEDESGYVMGSTAKPEKRLITHPFKGGRAR